jgi:hypothetical protein
MGNAHLAVSRVVCNFCKEVYARMNVKKDLSASTLNANHVKDAQRVKINPLNARLAFKTFSSSENLALIHVQMGFFLTR